MDKESEESQEVERSGLVLFDFGSESSEGKALDEELDVPLEVEKVGIFSRDNLPGSSPAGNEEEGESEAVRKLKVVLAFGPSCLLYCILWVFPK